MFSHSLYLETNLFVYCAALNVKQCGNNSLINYILSIGLDIMIIAAEKNII